MAYLPCACSASVRNSSQDGRARAIAIEQAYEQAKLSSVVDKLSSVVDKLIKEQATVVSSFFTAPNSHILGLGGRSFLK